MKRILLMVIFAVLTLGLTACPATETVTPTPGKIPAVATGNANLSILVEALTKANLVEALNANGPFTVFAPTNDAFAALLTELGVTKEQLLARADLADILNYHVVSGSAKAASLTNGQKLATLQTGEITVAVAADGKVSLNNGRANVTTADVAAANGVVHLIDKVLLPPAKPISVDVSLSGAQEVPALSNPGSSGGATVTLNGNTLTVDGSYSGFTATMAHVHGPAAAGSNASVVNGVMLNISVAGKFTGQLTLTDAQVTQFKNGLYYLNVHSAANSGGEIRGQIIPPAQ